MAKENATPSQDANKQTGDVNREQHVVTYKVILLGDAGVGKTSILNRLQGGDFKDKTQYTVGFDFVSKSYEIDGVKVHLQIWDSPGQEKFKSLTKSYSKGAMGAMFVYDITDMESFKILKFWLQSIEKDEGRDMTIPIVLLGNKADLSEGRQVTCTDGNKFMLRECLFEFLETSAVTGENIADAFRKLANHMLEVNHPQFMSTYKANFKRRTPSFNQRVMDHVINGLASVKSGDTHHSSPRKPSLVIKSPVKQVPTGTHIKAANNNNSTMGHGEGSGKGAAGILWAILWFIILIFLGWPIGFFIAWLYILLLPFSACISPLKDVCDSILKIVQLPLTCAENMINMKPLC